MSFEEYPKIENSYRKKFLDYLANYDLIGGEWIVQEKIHGANFQITYDGHEFKIGSRTKVITPESKFYANCYLDLVKLIRPKIRRLYEHMNATVITIYAELFGGSYEHKDVPTILGSKKIQKGVFYTPRNELYVFDIKTDDTYLSVYIIESLCQTYDIFYAKTLFLGSLEECLKYSNKFQTTIPEQFGLPPIKDNICEGIVIKPVVSKFTPDGLHRVILKNKNELFADKQSKPKMPKKIIPLSAEGQRLFDEFKSLITMARLDSVMSKDGSLTQKDFGNVIDLVFKDILVDFLKDEKDGFTNLEKTERVRITKIVRRDIVDTIRIEFFSRV